MPINVTRYLCSVCKQEYKDFNAALQCEMRFTPSNPFPDDADILFENEQSLLGQRYSYSTMSGKVLCSVLATKKNSLPTDPHIWVWIVKPTTALFSECLVLQAEDDFGTPKLFSPAEEKYHAGYADIIKNTLY